MRCIICNEKSNELKDNVCVQCEEAKYIYSSVLDAYDLWIESLHYEHVLWNRTEKLIKTLIKNIDKSLELITNIDIVLKKLEELIRNSIVFYSKVDIISSAIMIKEICRRYMLSKDLELDIWEINSEYQVALELIRIAVEIDESEFFGFSIGESDRNGNSSFITALALLRFYIIIIANKNNIKYIDREYNLEEVILNFIENEYMEKYFNEYGNMGSSESPEDYIIENVNLKTKLKNDKNSMEEIIRLTNEFINEGFNFNLDELRSLASIKGIELEKNIISIEKKEYFIKRHNDINIESILNIINTFSINNIKLDNKILNNQEVELASFYEYQDYIIWGNIDLIQNVSAFEKFSMSSHFLEKYNLDERVIKTARNIQKKLSTYLSYVIANSLYEKGYKLPMEKLPSKIGNEYTIRAEINKIKINGRNILQECGDIDVLALNIKNREVLNIEFKHYKPAMNMKELIYNDKDKIKGKKIIDKVQKRQMVIEENILDVVRYLGGPENEKFKVKSIIITSRPNFYGINGCEIIEYMTWNQFMDWLEKNN